MARIAILSTVNFKHMTVLTLYTDFLDRNEIPYDVIYIDKYGESEENNAVDTYSYQLSINREWNFLRKLRRYYGFHSFAKKIIKGKDYDFLIVWNSFTAIMFIDLLVLKFKGKYAFNIRDYNFEKIPFVYFLMKLIIKKSSFTTISSYGFKKFLPKHEYLSIHSFNENILLNIEPRENMSRKSLPIRISFIGYVRFFENDKKLIDLLGNDNRFIVQFFGEGAQYLKEYAEDNNYKNVICVGRFKPSDTSSFLAITDIVNNLYGYGKIELDTAISIKSYYAAYLNIPILVFKDTYMEEATRGFNFICDLESQSFPDDLYNWYTSINHDMLKLNCNQYLVEAKQENTYFKSILEKTIDCKEE
ncbi:hypothetical protein [Petrocella sp. FN5]|uniref:hypothetical protein n=1 Tax=Petrocella sp. FN5 TaxID=3032002 RepID=UPI0023DAB02D|nr:hypothetical protein [Petrocella sp. FN5]MDF1616955.1 hypothetical protein [Petrocella sp. FN5]